MRKTIDAIAVRGVLVALIGAILVFASPVAAEAKGDPRRAPGPRRPDRPRRRLQRAKRLPTACGRSKSNWFGRASARDRSTGALDP